MELELMSEWTNWKWPVDWDKLLLKSRAKCLPTYSPYIKIKGEKYVQELHYEISSLDVTLRYELGVCAIDRQQTELHK